ncbi:MAG: transporter substrate-binding domain-containing protein [Aurantibacter sp.]
MKIGHYILLIILALQPIFAQTANDSILKVGYTSAPPFIIENGENLEGINIWLWTRTAKELGLRYELIPMEFSKMLNALETGELDVSINPLTITGERSKKMEFTHTFYASNATIAVSELSSYEKLVQFLKGFFNLNFIKGFALLLAIIFLFGFFGWTFERRENPGQFRSGSRGIWDGLWWSAVTLTTVGYGDKAPKTKMGKIAALILMFGGLLFISGLTASIASSLTVNQLSSDPDNLNEFKDRKVGSVKNTETTAFLRNHFFKNIELYDNVSAGLSALKENEIEAFIYDEPILKYRIQQDTTLNELSILPVKFDVQFYAFGVTKQRSELERTLSQKVLEISETNEWQVLLNEYGLTEL